MRFLTMYASARGRL